MKIAVGIKRVPDMESRFKIGASAASVDESGLKFDMADFDGYAAEVALRLVEQHGGETVAVSLGPDPVQETLRKALSMGIDRAVQLKVDAVPFDGFVVATALADALRGGGHDLILFGKLATDTGHGAVGPMVAELLDLPCVTSATFLEIAADRGTAHRAIEGGTEVVTFPLPAVVTVDEGIARPRYPSLKGIMAAKKKPLTVTPVALAAPRLTVRAMALPPDRPPGRIIGEGAAAVAELVRLLQTEAKVL